MFSTVKVALIAVTLFFCSAVSHAQQAQTLTQAVQLIGLAGLNENTKGNLTVINGALRFIHAKGNADVAATSIENVVTGTDSQRTIGGTLGTLTQLAPFGSGRALSLFRTKLDTLTIQYRDADGGLHGVIFTVPLGKAEIIKQQLIAQGAHTSIPTQADPKKTKSDPKGSLLRAKEHQPATRATAIQVMMIRADATPLPAEFQISLYGNLIDQLRKKSVFQQVYRDGDRNAAAEPELIELQCTVQKFEKGSERMRQVTTVAGATSMTLRCEFKDKGGNLLLERDITGKVRFFGGNLKATYDFAKKTANVAAENFSAVTRHNSLSGTSVTMPD